MKSREPDALSRYERQIDIKARHCCRTAQLGRDGTTSPWFGLPFIRQMLQANALIVRNIVCTSSRYCKGTAHSVLSPDTSRCATNPADESGLAEARPNGSSPPTLACAETCCDDAGSSAGRSTDGNPRTLHHPYRMRIATLRARLHVPSPARARDSSRPGRVSSLSAFLLQNRQCDRTVAARRPPWTLQSLPWDPSICWPNDSHHNRRETLRIMDAQTVISAFHRHCTWRILPDGRIQSLLQSPRHP